MPKGTSNLTRAGRQLATDKSATPVLILTENKCNLLDGLGDVLDRLQIIFYPEPFRLVFRVMGLE
jgi:hypothetical protein